MTDGPFPGLVPYGDDHAEYFFGRASAQRAVLDSLIAYRMTILYGQSGVGKSSLLHAGVLHGVREAQEYGVVAVRSWTRDPLAAVLEDLDAQPGDTLATAIDRTSQAIGAPLLIVLDQFEEYCLYHPASDEEDSFDGQLARAVAHRSTAANFMISIREDALSRLDRYDGRIPGLLDNLLRLEHLDREAAQEATERPLALWRERGGAGPAEAEPGLIATLLDQVQEGTLHVGEAEGVVHDAREHRVRTPYLQLVLARLWDEEQSAQSPVLRLRTLERLGGAERIVATHLDAAMDRLAPRERAVAAAVFRQLVTPSGAKIAQSSRDLAVYANVPEARVTPVLERLTRESRILQALDESRYEIYHDALAAPILAWQGRWQLRRARWLGRLRLLAMLLLAASWLLLLAFAAPNLESATVDTRFSLLGPSSDPRIVIVAIDNRSLDALGPWPFSRKRHAQLINRLRRAKARVIAYNIQFTEASTTAADNALFDAVRSSAEHGVPVVLASTEVVNGKTTIFGGGEGLKESRAHAANSTQATDRDGAIRHMRWQASGLQTFPVVTAGLALGRPIPRSALGGKSAWIDYRGPFRKLSFLDLLRGRVPDSALRGKVVIVGSTAPTLQDFHSAATSPAMAGSEILANETSTVLRGFPRRDGPGFLVPLVTLAFGLLVPLASRRLALWLAAVLGVVVAALYCLVVQLLFAHGTVLPVVYPLGALVFTTIAVLFVGGVVVRSAQA